MVRQKFTVVELDCIVKGLAVVDLQVTLQHGSVVSRKMLTMEGNASDLLGILGPIR